MMVDRDRGEMRQSMVSGIGFGFGFELLQRKTREQESGGGYL